MAQPIPDVAAVAKQTRQHQESRTRTEIYRAIIGKFGKSETSTTVNAANSATLMEELTAQGYTASHNGAEWIIDWSKASNVPDSNKGRMFPRADIAKEKCLKSGPMFVQDTIVRQISAASGEGKFAVTIELEDQPGVRQKLAAAGYTVTHDGAAWNITWSA